MNLVMNIKMCDSLCNIIGLALLTNRHHLANKSNFNMFTCLMKIWDWLDPSGMEYKQSIIESPSHCNDVVQHIDMIPRRPAPMDKTIKLFDNGTPRNAIQQYYHQYNIMQPNVGYRCIQQPIVDNSLSQPQMQYNELSDNFTGKQNQVDSKKKTAFSSDGKKSFMGPISMQGWLYKQGYEGLKVWRKRWFVLSNNYLYYFKGPEKGKMLGSINLSSYKILLNGSEDKVYRKFVFKCEHTIMRTYFLGADSQEHMNNWIRALNQNCMLQPNVESDRQSGPSVSSVNNASLENSESEYHPHCQSYTYNVPVHLYSDHSASENLSNQSYPSEFCKCVQPLYANAPPKPRRSLETGYATVIPEFANNKYNEYNPPCVPARQYYQKYPENNMHIQQQIAEQSDVIGGHYMQSSQMPTCIQDCHYPQDNNNMFHKHNDERRTPDIYGRSNMMKEVSDYEDVYTDDVIYKRPFSPIPYNYTTKRISPVITSQAQQRSFAPVTNLELHKKFAAYTLDAPPRNKQPNVIARPHSADFLELKNHDACKFNEVHKQPPRPKSSLDISEDNFYYSEESYAEHMRKSALYLQQLPNQYQMPESEQFYATNGHNFSHHKNGMHPNLRNIDVRKRHSTRSTSGGSLDMNLGSNEKSSLSDLIEGSAHIKEQVERLTRGRILRSPSIQRKATTEQHILHNKDNNQKREESMTRLLEWKKRMLPSPLHHFDLRRTMAVPNFENIFPVDPRHSYKSLPQYCSYSSDDEASLSMTENENLQRTSQRMWCPLPTINNFKKFDIYSESGYHVPQTNIDDFKQIDRQWGSSLNMSAGDLLGRTYEELVLLLIQLRRQSANNHHAIEAYYTEIDNLQYQQCNMDITKLQKLEKLKQQVLELEKKHEKGKPLINLVDNMVKLGTLYRSSNDCTPSPNVWNRLEFNQQIQEQRLLAEERKEWKRINSDHAELQSKIQQLYQFDKLLQEESSTLHCLQQDKQKIEKALSELRHHLHKGQRDTFGIELVRKQQILLENELSKVYFMLAENSKKLEETVTGNARLEQELLVLRQKLHLSRDQRSSSQFSNADDSLTCTTGTSAMLETEFQKVQLLVADLQRQREELSMQVHQLTDRSRRLSQQVFPSNIKQHNYNSDGERVSATNEKKLLTTYWRETDLDTMQEQQHKYHTMIPLNIRTDSSDNLFEPDRYCNRETYIDERNIELQQEKSDIKTVRIVKRENERKQKDKEKYNFSYTTSEPIYKKKSWKSDARDIIDTSNYFYPSREYSSENLLDLDQENDRMSTRILKETYHNENNILDGNDVNMYKSAQFTNSETRKNVPKTLDLEPAQHIQNSIERRVIPKEKRRRYTAPHNSFVPNGVNNVTPDEYLTGMNSNNRRARDDLDMERALRQKIYTPDIVRSTTLSNKEPKYNENTIDDLLGTPNKISIPERYVPEQLPQLSHEEEQYRLRKIESIKKMLSDTTILSSTTSSIPQDNKSEDSKPTTIVEEKRQREHLLQLNQILAKQVMEISKIVAEKAVRSQPLESHNVDVEEDDLSPVTALPLYQQRDNYFS